MSTGSGDTDPNPQNRAAQLAQLKFILSKLPYGSFGPEIDINPPDNIGPVSINLKDYAKKMQAKSIMERIEILETFLKLANDYKRPVPSFIDPCIEKLEQELYELMGK